MKIAQLHKLLFFQFLTHFIPFFKLKYFFKYLIYKQTHKHTVSSKQRRNAVVGGGIFIFFINRWK